MSLQFEPPGRDHVRKALWRQITGPQNFYHYLAGLSQFSAHCFVFILSFTSATPEIHAHLLFSRLFWPDGCSGQLRKKFILNTQLPSCLQLSLPCAITLPSDAIGAVLPAGARYNMDLLPWEIKRVKTNEFMVKLFCQEARVSATWHSPWHLHFP